MERGEMLKMSVKRVREEAKLPLKSKGIHKASCDLRRLQSLLAKSNPRKEVAKGCSSRASSSPHPPKHSRRHVGDKDICNEESELEKFSMTYKDQRYFSSHPLSKLFSDILVSLVKNRLCSEWIDQAPSELALRVLTCLRLLIRDSAYQRVLHQLQGISSLARYMESVTAKYMTGGEQWFAAQQLVTMTYMFQKLSAAENQRGWVIQSGAHRTLVKLLSTTDSGVLLGALLALITLAESPEYKNEIGEPPIVASLLTILQEYDLPSKRMAAELLRLLSPVQRVRGRVGELEGVPVLLSLLHGRHLQLLWSVTWILVQLCEDPDSRSEIRSWGGVQPLLRLLNSDRQYVSDRSCFEKLSSSNSADRILREHMGDGGGPLEESNSSVALKSACCTALTELSLDDASAHHIVLENGIFIIAKLILPHYSGPKAHSLQCYAFRTLRFLFSVERNRHLFKRLFPTDLFEMFIDVGHYVRDLAAYEGLQTKISLLAEEELDSLRENIEAVDQNRPPLRVVNGYSILDHLGTGAFGSVFKVRKQSGQNLLALKEVNLHNPVFGKDKKSRDSNVEKIISELTIIREQMTHPNIVRYYKTFLEGEKLYVVMELIEGVPLAEHFNSLKEKQQRFTEDRIWKIFIQMCLALRYLHKEKRIVHRDLSPNNIMLGEQDRVTITDFGLAKQKQESSKLTSVVGTILYSCPEVVKNEPYGEKADIWALGCVLYQMATLQPPFYSSNMLALASKIVEAAYEPVEEEAFSERVTDMIRWCLSPDADRRPDIVAVGSRISDLMMSLMDGLYSSHHALERRAEKERKRAQKYFLERHKATCHQERPLREADSPAQNSSAACCSDLSQQRISQDDTLREGVKPSEAKNDPGASTGTQNILKPSGTPDITADRDFSPLKMKPRPVSSGICVSQKRLRQIDDPVQRLLVQLHKIISITQLPPAPHHSIKRGLVERFKKSLFQLGSNPYNLKAELGKLLQASPELVASSDWWSLVHRLPAGPHPADRSADGSLKDGVTYQQMQGIIEELLEENGYYEAPHSMIKEERDNRGKK
ncbi:serine/threonine-protein kinase Nek10 [Menidia menidia]